MRILALLFACCCLSSSVEAQDYRPDMDKMLSPDPELALPDIALAVERHEGERLLLVWLLAANADGRKAALTYYLELETEDPGIYQTRLRRISDELDERLREIDDVAKATRVSRPLDSRKAAAKAPPAAAPEPASVGDDEAEAIRVMLPPAERSAVTAMTRLGVGIVMVRIGTVPGSNGIGALRIMQLRGAKWVQIAEEHYGS
jgi:hypothetical protein